MKSALFNWFLGIFADPRNEVQSLVPPQARRQDLGLKITVEGDPDHQHHFEEVRWDRERLGDQVIGMDSEDKKWGMATYQTLKRCSCGREGIHSCRTLI